MKFQSLLRVAIKVGRLMLSPASYLIYTAREWQRAYMHTVLAGFLYGTPGMERRHQTPGYSKCVSPFASQGLRIQDGVARCVHDTDGTAFHGFGGSPRHIDDPCILCAVERLLPLPSCE